MQRGHPCSPKPCRNGGICIVDGDTTFVCLCPVQFTGKIYVVVLICWGRMVARNPSFPINSSFYNDMFVEKNPF